jgi:hypothetical protein
MNGTFSIHINLGNDAMQTADDVTNAIQRVLKRLNDLHSARYTIMDDNGNSVGKCIVDDDESDDDESDDYLPNSRIDDDSEDSFPPDAL